MRTTLRLPDLLMHQAKVYALSHGRTLTQVMEEALQALLSRRPDPIRSQKISLTTFKGKGLRPGIDLDSMQSILDAMESS